MLYVTVTIDAEGVHGPDPYNNMMHGKWSNSNKEYGINFLVTAICNYGVVPTVFFDIYEKSLFGEKVIIETGEELLKRRVDLQLHTHPGWRVDKRDSLELQQLKKGKSFLSSDKDLMAKLSLNEQIDLIAAGKIFFSTYFGVNVTAHRSGGYSVNADTIEALKANRIFIDSSYNSEHHNSKYEGHGITFPCFIDEVLQVPITHFRRFHFGVAENKLRPTSTSALTLEDLRRLVEVGTDRNLFINYFLHSYSLIKFNKSFTKFKFSPSNHCYLKRHLKLLTESKNVKFVGLDYFYKKRPELVVSDILKTEVHNTPSYYVERISKRFL